MTTANLVHGIKHLLGAPFHTPAHLRHVFDEAPAVAEHPDEPELISALNDADLRDLLNHWGQQQAVAWVLGRVSAWLSIILLAVILL